MEDPDDQASPAADDPLNGPASMLDQLNERPVAEHPEIFQAVDEELAAQLAALDDLD